jgi:hypothetical protein
MADHIIYASRTVGPAGPKGNSPDRQIGVNDRAELLGGPDDRHSDGAHAKCRSFGPREVNGRSHPNLTVRATSCRASGLEIAAGLTEGLPAAKETFGRPRGVVGRPRHNHSRAFYGLDAPPPSGAASALVLRICSRISSLDLTSLTSLTAIAPVR